MQSVKELLAKHGVENATLESEISALITSAETKNSGIPKDRFDAVISERNGLRADKSELEAQITTLKQTIESKESEISRLTGIETQYTTMKTQAEQIELSKWQERKKVFAVDPADVNYEKIQKVVGKFALGDNLTPEQVSVNNKLFETYEEIGYFAIDDKNYVPGKKPGTGGQNEKNPFMPESWNLTEQALLFKSDPAKYERMKKAAGK